MATTFRRVLPVLAVLLLAPTVRAESVQWRKNFDAAVREAKAKNRPILVKFTAEWCTYCHKMERTTFKDDAIVAHVNGAFVPVIVDADDHEELMQAMGVKALPTTVLLSPDQRVLTKLKGYKKPDQLGPELAAVAPLRAVQPLPERVAAVPVALPAPADEKPISFGGHCLVTLREERRLQPGDPAVTTVYRGVRVAFADGAAKKAFFDNPTRYWPMWDGRCPVTAVNEGRSVEGVPITGAVYRDRLWFFADRDHRAVFDETPARFVPSIAAENPGTRRN